VSNLRDCIPQMSSWDAVPLLPDQPGLVRRSLEASVWIDVFTPIREELLPGARA
jgi:hypothetical protein